MSVINNVPRELLANFIEYSVPGHYDCDEKWFADKRALFALLATAQPAADGEHVPDEVFQDEFQAWWEEHGQYCRAGGGAYERAFAFQAWRHLYPMLMRARAALSAPSHGEQVREWVQVGERLPDTKPGTEADFIVAIRRAHNGKTYVVPASFLNRFELYSEDEAADDEGRIYVTGWYREMADDEYDTAWHKMETEGDVITDWQELPAAPSAGSQGGDV